MTDPLQGLTEQLAADPDSLVFLELGEALRRRGLLDAALAVAETGLRRHRDLAAAWDLLGRVRSDRGDGDGAFDAWTEALRRQPRHVGALRGLAYLAFRAGDLTRAERHLALAVETAPEDGSLQAALERLRQARRSADPGVPPIQSGLAIILADAQGQLLVGRLPGADGRDVSEAVAAELAEVFHEAARAARLLQLGRWRGVSIESPAGRLHLAPVSGDTLLLALAGPDVPARRLVLETERAVAAASRWLERLR